MNVIRNKFLDTSHIKFMHLVPAPLWHQYSEVVQKMHIMVLFGTNLHKVWWKFSTIIKKNIPELHLLKMFFWDEFSAHRSMERAPVKKMTLWKENKISSFWYKSSSYNLYFDFKLE